MRSFEQGRGTGRTRVGAAALLAMCLAACAPLPDRAHNASAAAASHLAGGIGTLATGATIEAEKARTRSVMDSLYDAASTSCEPKICAAVARGEALLGMGEAQLYAATRSLPAAWSIRRSGAAASFVPASATTMPKDTRGDIALVALADGHVVTIVYRDGATFHVVSNDRENTAELNWTLARRLDTEGRTAEALVRYRLAIDGAATARAGWVRDSLTLARQRVAALERSAP